MSPASRSSSLPRLTIICGNAGVGKTTFASKLARQTGACLLDIDTVSEGLVRAGMIAAGLDPNDRDSPQFKTLFRDPIHETLYAIAQQNLPHRDCIIVAPFTQERRDPNFYRDCCARFTAQVEILHLTCREETRKQRIQLRGNPRDAGKLADWRAYSKQGRDEGPPPFPHQQICTD